MIDASALAAGLAEGSLQAVDCRFRLGDPGAGLALFREGHLPGARRLDLDADLSAPVRADRLGGRHPLPDREAFAAALRAAGIAGDRAIVLYDDETGGAARAWWLLRHHGVPSRVLRGGIAAWEGALEEGDPAPLVGDLQLGGERIGDHVDADAVRAALAAGRLVLDARAPERYRGEVEPIDPVAGHIDGAINAPFGAEPPAAALEATEPPIAYCGSGVSACVLLLRLAEAGRDDALLYPGSWSDWCARGLAQPASAE
jgi:thiosulfate/3-mercaptopyruvate sulfurtransferase